MSGPQEPGRTPEGVSPADDGRAQAQFQPPQTGYPSQPTGYPSQPIGYPPQPGGTPPPKRGLPVGAIIGIVGGGLVLLIAIVIGIAIAGGLLAGARTPSTEERGPVATDVVTGYLEALAASDAESALSYLGSKPADTTFLTDEVLEVANAEAPISDIRVIAPSGEPESEYSADIPVRYMMGDTPVSTTIRVSNYDLDAGWTVTGGTAQIELGTRFAGLAMTLNGMPVEGQRAEVFPGAYVLATTTPSFELVGDTTLLITEPFTIPDTAGIQATLTEEGIAVFRQVATASVNECLTSKTLAAGCGLTIPETLSDGTKIVDGTITRSLGAEAQAKLASLTPQESFGDPLFVQSDSIGSVEVTADCQSGGQSYAGCSFLFLPSLGAPLVDFTTDPPTVRWD